MTNILIVNTGFTYSKINYGGVNKMLLWLGNTLPPSKYNITFCSIHDSCRSDKILPQIKSIELNVPYYDSICKRYTIGLYKSYKSLNKLFKEKKYNYVINFDGIIFFILLILKLKWKYNFIVSERADPNYNNSFISKFKRSLYRYVDILVCQTSGAAACFNEKIRRQSIVIPNPISIPNEIWNRNDIQKSIATVGRLNIWQKRQDVIIRAFEIIHQTQPNYKLNIYGSGDDLGRLESLAKELHVYDSINFNGYTKDVKSALLNNEIFVLTSDFEGIPNALLEAMSIGMPVISTKCSPGGAEFLIENGKNGMLTECGDYKAIACAILKLINNPELSDSIAYNARETAKQFNPQNIIKLWEDLLI